ncbi:CYTH domain-containing protein [Patescibacteria group bacterium]|nr:CYTH domain-containing protein [Patescibacteria group bacterium]
MNSHKNTKEAKQEAKNLLSAEAHRVLKEYFGIDPKLTRKHEDHIFMDKRKLLRDLVPAVLRVRVFHEGESTLEFKLPQPCGDVQEYTDPLNDLEYEEFFSSGMLINELTVFDALKKRGIQEPFHCIGSITTIRSRVPFKNTWSAKIFLDQVWLTDTSFYCEIKVVTKDARRSQQVLEEICALHNSPLVDTRTKIELFLQALEL